MSYAASYFDKADRLVTAVDVGTYGGSAYSRPTTPDGRDDNHLRIDYGFNAAGWVESVTDPAPTPGGAYRGRPTSRRSKGW